jgi:hypothetical protein
MRKAYTRENTLWMDSEIKSLWYGGDVFNNSGTNPALPQAGHFHRGYFDEDGYWRAIVITNNIFASDVNVINANVWNMDPTEAPVDQLDLGSAGGSKTYTDAQLMRQLRILGVNRIIFGVSINEYMISPPHAWGIVAATDVIIDTKLDSTFAVATAAPMSAVGLGYVQMQDAEGGAAVAHKFEAGTITPTQASARRYWPYWVASQLRGGTLKVKVWREKDPEPSWSSDHVATYNFTGANAPGAGARYPDEPGECGLIGAHLRNGRYLEYGEFRCRNLGVSEIAEGGGTGSGVEDPPPVTSGQIWVLSDDSGEPGWIDLRTITPTQAATLVWMDYDEDAERYEWQGGVAPNDGWVNIGYKGPELPATAASVIGARGYVAGDVWINTAVVP